MKPRKPIHPGEILLGEFLRPALPTKPLLPNNSTACPKSRSNPDNGIHGVS
jgi:hypothetical protein